MKKSEESDSDPEALSIEDIQALTPEEIQAVMMKCKKRKQKKP